jgi:pyruvate,water dikinase
MGVKEGLPLDLARRFEAASLRARLGDFLHLCATVAGLVRARWRLPRIKARFMQRVQTALRPPAIPFEHLRADELAAAYRALERQLLTRWDAPLLNDFFAMIYFGVLRKLCARWLGAGGDSLANDLVGNAGGMVSTEPARRVEEMAAVVAQDAELAQTLARAPVPEALAAARAHAQLGPRLQDYLDKFGDRCMEELKLESPTLREDAGLLLRSIGRLAMRGAPAGRSRYAAREQAEQRVAVTLGRRPFRRWLFQRVLRQARNYVRDRENLRLERTRLFARVRVIFKALGRRLVEVQQLEQTGDIFYLTVPEALGFVEGLAVTTRLKELVALRRQEFEGYRAGPPPADRFETRGLVYVGNPFQAAVAAGALTGDEARGLACCPGLVRRRVRVVLDPRGAEMQPGEILVAARTDPGWVMLFPAASGLIVEHGSLLSHSAIVARELGLPAVVALAGATAWLQTGDEVELDGASGVVRRLAPAEAAHAQ